MDRNWTFGRKIGAGFAVTVALTLVLGVISVYALRSVVTAKDNVISVNSQSIMDADELGIGSARRVAAVRGYFLTKQGAYLQEIQERRAAFFSTLSRMRQNVHDPEGQRLLQDIEFKEADYGTISDSLVVLRQGDTSLEAIAQRFDDEVVPKHAAMGQAIDAFVVYAKRTLENEKQAATAAATSAITLVIVIAIIIVILAIMVAFYLTRTLSRQIGTAISQVQSSSAELQAAANQQATGTKEQATVANEITTTISELLATSRQIAESAQRVAQIAAQTTDASRIGEGTVEKGQDAIAGIQRQVDMIVHHMLELGKKSQHIGVVLNIVAELAEQTNILAINATIEAAGAGEAGKRFMVVAEEIRKLADRVGDSTKEVRTLIDDVQSAANTTVMTTEAGSKAVEAGAERFTEVASAFKQIAGLVATTMEAAKEIELSTKQQTTAVEQVNIAVANVAQASKEAEATTGQTLQTASQLTMLSRDLLRLVRPQTTPHLPPAPDPSAG